MSFILSGDAYKEPMQVTYGEFVQQVNRTANLFHDLGVVEDKVYGAVARIEIKTKGGVSGQEIEDRVAVLLGLRFGMN